MTPIEVLDHALTHPPGVGEPLEFASRPERDRFAKLLFSAMSADARRSRRLDPPDDPDWGRHRWSAVRTQKIGARVLWVGRESAPEVGEPMTLQESMTKLEPDSPRPRQIFQQLQERQQRERQK